MLEFAIYVDSVQSYMLPCPLDSMSSWYNNVDFLNDLIYKSSVIFENKFLKNKIPTWKLTMNWILSDPGQFLKIFFKCLVNRDFENLAIQISTCAHMYLLVWSTTYPLSWSKYINTSSIVGTRRGRTRIEPVQHVP